MSLSCLMQCMLEDIVAYSCFINGVNLRSYQARAGATLYHAVLSRQGNAYTVMFPRQSGKNELQAQIESALLVGASYKGGEIVKISPTYTTQSETSRFRLARTLENSQLALNWSFERERSLRIGKASIRMLSGNKRASIVGATASLLLEVDEAQDISISKFDKEIAPMAASTNAVRIFWGTAWDDMTLLAREQLRNRQAEGAHEQRRAFLVDADQVAQEVPAYAEFVRQQIDFLGRDHPSVRTQLYCEEITDESGMFNTQRLRLMQGCHAPQDWPLEHGNYVFLIDVAGSDELTKDEKRERGFSDQRDATVITICQLIEPLQPGESGVTWNVVARRFYRNVEVARVKQLITAEIEIWNPSGIAIDSNGLGFDLAAYLNSEYAGITHSYSIGAGTKTLMARSFLALINSSRWQEYKVPPMPDFDTRPYKKGDELYEIITDAGQLQKMFFQQLHYCRMEAAGDESGNLRWGVPSAARDPETGALIHDDLLMSAAIAGMQDYNMDVIRNVDYSEPPTYAQIDFNPDERKISRERWLWENT